MNKHKLRPIDVINWYSYMGIDEVIDEDFESSELSAAHEQYSNSSSLESKRRAEDNNTEGQKTNSNASSEYYDSANANSSHYANQQELSSEAAKPTGYSYPESASPVYPSSAYNNNQVHGPANQSSNHFTPGDAINKALGVAASCSTVEELREAVHEFEDCPLKKTATNTVFADGNANSDIMLIGEAPGASEDKYGIPFCGESGQLLDNIFKSIGFSRENNLYISNTIFWRPPGNRVPTNEEIEICRPFLEKHIYLAAPKLLILVGSTSAMSLLGKKLKITQARQQIFHYNNQYLKNSIPTTAIFHPAYLLRQPHKKKSTWEDMLKIKEFLANTST